jgi:O-antigen ligase
MIARVMATLIRQVDRTVLVRCTRWALALTVAAAPLYVVRWHVGPLPSTLLEVLELLTIALYMLTIWRHRRPLPKRTAFDIPILVFLVAGLIGIFVAPDHRGALGIFRAYLLEPIALFYVAITVIDSDDAIESFLVTWGAGTVLFGLIEVVTFLRVLVAGRLVPGNAAAAFNIDANGVSMYLEPLIGLTAAFALFGQPRHRWIALGMMACLIPAEVSTLSRGGLLALAVLVVIAFLTIQDIRIRIGLALSAVTGAVVIRLLPVVGTRAANGINPESTTLFGRISIWILTVRMLRDHPVFGAGINAYQSTMSPYRTADPNLGPELYPHNLLLTTWTELGLLGLAAFIYILVNLLVRPWRVLARATGIYRPLLWGLGTAFAVIAVHGVFDSPYWKNDLSLEFWMLAALEVVALAAVGPKAKLVD